MTLTSGERKDRQQHVRTEGRGGRFYVDAHGRKFWSVTTLLKGIPKDALMYWTAKEAAKCAVNELDRIKAIIGDDGKGADAAIKYIKDACWRSSGEKMDLGTAVHEAIEAFVLDKPHPKWDAKVEPFMEQFFDFLLRHEPEVVASELVVYNRSQVYAGTLDLIARMPHLDPEVFGENPTLVLDTKTGSGVYPETALQLAAYRHAEFIELPDGSEREMPSTDGGAVLHLRADGWDLIPVETDQTVFDSFLYSREVYRWTQETSKSAVGKPLPVPKEVAA